MYSVLFQQMRRDLKERHVTTSIIYGDNSAYFDSNIDHQSSNAPFSKSSNRRDSSHRSGIVSKDTLRFIQWETIDNTNQGDSNNNKNNNKRSTNTHNNGIVVSPQALLILDAILSDDPQASYYPTFGTSDNNDTPQRFLRVYSPVRKYLRKLLMFWFNSDKSCSGESATSSTISWETRQEQQEKEKRLSGCIYMEKQHKFIIGKDWGTLDQALRR